MIKMQDRFDFYIMLQLKEKQLKLSDLGSKKDLNEPNFQRKSYVDKLDLFDELDMFKKLAAKSSMDEERELIKEDL